MEYLIGVVLAAATCVVFGMLAGFDRERIFYPMMLPPIATYYVLFAAMVGSMPALTIESLVACLFLMLMVVGFKKNLWLVVAALVGHGVFDFFHHLIIQNPGVPVWWPGFCMSFDVLAGGFLAVLLARRSGFERALSRLDHTMGPRRGAKMVRSSTGGMQSSTIMFNHSRPPVARR